MPPQLRLCPHAFREAGTCTIVHGQHRVSARISCAMIILPVPVQSAQRHRQSAAVSVHRTQARQKELLRSRASLQMRTAEGEAMTWYVTVTVDGADPQTLLQKARMLCGGMLICINRGWHVTRAADPLTPSSHYARLVHQSDAAQLLSPSCALICLHWRWRPVVTTAWQSRHHTACMSQVLINWRVLHDHLMLQRVQLWQEEASMFGESEYGNAMSLLGVTEVGTCSIARAASRRIDRAVPTASFLDHRG